MKKISIVIAIVIAVIGITATPFTAIAADVKGEGRLATTESEIFITLTAWSQSGTVLQKVTFEFYPSDAKGRIETAEEVYSVNAVEGTVDFKFKPVRVTSDVADAIKVVIDSNGAYKATWNTKGVVQVDVEATQKSMLAYD